MPKFNNILKMLRKSENLTQKELAQKLGVSLSAISMYECGKREPDFETLEAIADYFNVNMNYLLGKGDTSSQIPTAANIIPLPLASSIPLVGNIACGEPILAEENIEGYVKAPAYCEGSFALRCKGDSMTGARIMDGDIVIIRQQSDIDDGEIAAVLIEDEATLKRVYKMPDRLILRAENPCYAPIDISGGDLANVRILGKAVYFISNIK